MSTPALALSHAAPSRRALALLAALVLAAHTMVLTSEGKLYCWGSAPGTGWESHCTPYCPPTSAEFPLPRRIHEFPLRNSPFLSTRF